VKLSSDCRQWDVEFRIFYNYQPFYRTSKSIYLNHLRENHAVIKKIVHENDKMAAKTVLVIYYGKSSDSILRICPVKGSPLAVIKIHDRSKKVHVLG